MNAPVSVLRWGERRGREDGPPVLIVTVNGWDAGLVALTPQGWTALARPRGLFTKLRRHAATVHPDPFAAVAAVLGSPFSRSRGAGAFSLIRWSDAAAEARDTWSTETAAS